jgi:hypothetical protein
MTRPALHDPPEFAHLPVALVYGAGDLAPELRLAIQQIAGWMWVTRTKGVAWGRGKSLGVTIGELAERWAISERTVQWRLQRLAEADYLETQYTGGGWVKLRLGSAALDTHTQTHTHTDTHTDTGSRNGIARESDSHAMPLRDRATPLRGPNTNIVVGVDTDPPEDTQQQQDTIAALRACGVWEPEARELAGDPWVTAERVQRSDDELLAQETAGQRWRTSRQAVLVANLRAHREPPAPESGGRRFVEGPYAEFIEH